MTIRLRISPQPDVSANYTIELNLPYTEALGLLVYLMAGSVRQHKRTKILDTDHRAIRLSSSADVPTSVNLVRGLKKPNKYYWEFAGRTMRSGGEIALMMELVNSQLEAYPDDLTPGPSMVPSRT